MQEDKNPQPSILKVSEAPFWGSWPTLGISVQNHIQVCDLSWISMPRARSVEAPHSENCHSRDVKKKQASIFASARKYVSFD